MPLPGAMQCRRLPSPTAVGEGLGVRELCGDPAWSTPISYEFLRTISEGSNLGICGAKLRQGVAGNGFEPRELGWIERVVDANVANSQLDQTADFIAEAFRGLVVPDGSTTVTGF